MWTDEFGVRCQGNTHDLISTKTGRPFDHSTNSFSMSSPLVEGFTPAEREALSKFKKEYLQSALTEASGDVSSTSTHEIWNIPIVEDDGRVDVIIVKFLRAKYIPYTVHGLMTVNSCCQKRIHSSSTRCDGGKSLIPGRLQMNNMIRCTTQWDTLSDKTRRED